MRFLIIFFFSIPSTRCIYLDCPCSRFQPPTLWFPRRGKLPAPSNLVLIHHLTPLRTSCCCSSPFFLANSRSWIIAVRRKFFNAYVMGSLKHLSVALPESLSPLLNPTLDPTGEPSSRVMHTHSYTHTHLHTLSFTVFGQSQLTASRERNYIPQCTQANVTCLAHQPMCAQYAPRN